MSSSNRPWPPLIVARHVSRIIKWRDILLTLMMWGFFAVLLDTEFELFLGNYLEQLGLGPFDTNANWPVFFARLMPFLLTAAILAGLLIIFGLRTLRRRSRSERPRCRRECPDRVSNASHRSPQPPASAAASRSAGW